MTIHRFSSAEGFPLEPGDGLVDVLRRMAEDPAVEVTRLLPGEHDVSPAHGHDNYRHNLIVHDNGTATLRAIPTQPGAAMAVETPDGELDIHRGGRMVALPEQMPATCILGSRPGDLGQRIFEVILHGQE